MKIGLASTADLYREHRRTPSARKKALIARELQRRHDELMDSIRPGNGPTWWGTTWVFRSNYDGTGFFELKYFEMTRYDFSLLLS